MARFLRDLRVVCVLSGLVVLGIAIPINQYIRFTSGSVTYDLLLVTLVVVACLGHAWCLASLVNRWLERRAAAQLVEEGFEDVGEALTGGTGAGAIRLSALLVVSIVGVGGLVDGPLLGNFSTYYEVQGRYQTILRSPDTQAHAEVTREMAGDTMGPDLSLYVESFFIPMLNEPERVEMALGALWVVGERMGRSLDLIRYTNAESGGWEQDLFRLLRQEAGPPVRALALGPETSHQAAALRALGSFRTSQDTATLIGALQLGAPQRLGALDGLSAHKGKGETAIALIDALGQSKGSWDDEAIQRGLFAVGEILMLWHPSRVDEEHNDAVESAVQALGLFLESQDMPSQCVGIGSLRKARIPSASKSLFAVFERAGKADECPEITWFRPPLGPQALSSQGLLRFRILDALSLSALGNEEIEVWVGKQNAKLSEFSLPIQTALQSLEAKLGRTTP